MKPNINRWICTETRKTNTILDHNPNTPGNRSNPPKREK